MTDVTTGQFVEEIKKVLGEGVVIIDKVAAAKSNAPISNSTDSRRGSVNQELSNVLQEGLASFSRAEQVLRAGAIAQAASGSMRHSGIFHSAPADASVSQEPQMEISPASFSSK